MKKILLLLIIGILLNGCNKKINHYQLTRFDASKTTGSKKDGKWHGEVKSYYGNGNLLGVTTFNNGKKEGVDVTYNITGDEVEYATYTNDILNGLKKQYYYTKKGKAQLESKVMYINGKKNGEEITYFKNGKLHCKTMYKKDKREGKRYCYDRKGKEASITTYKNGLEDGLSTYWRHPYQQAPVKITEHYINGKRIGKVEISRNEKEQKKFLQTKKEREEVSKKIEKYEKKLLECQQNAYKSKNPIGTKAYTYDVKFKLKSCKVYQLQLDNLGSYAHSMGY